jgi:hypothetical protein
VLPWETYLSSLKQNNQSHSGKESGLFSNYSPSLSFSWNGICEEADGSNGINTTFNVRKNEQEMLELPSNKENEKKIVKLQTSFGYGSM